MPKITTVCMVDDANGMRKLGSALLASMGIDVVLAKDGYQALRMLQLAPPDACFIDIEMPGLDGLKLVSILRSNKRFERMPIAMLSGASSPFDRQKGLLAGADIYLSKPFTKDTLVKAIEQMEAIASDQ
ncbi:response regulator (plasmid) [Halopseudomonas sp. SMJS2]|uniref:response regulator n=1 Tax=Halopseudomonas sp. SMJS2 TaxID=3041098 RepID=UPI002452BCB9|nr:response regulator [Halopseudomonas sp. SMJS2]WGK63384.1 response regulator [Halopseudomonas sp. SMJS2]